MQPLPPTPESPSMPPELVVRSDTTRLRRRFGGLLVMQGLLLLVTLVGLVVVAWLGLREARPYVWPLALLLVAEVAMLARTCYLWGRRLVVVNPLTLSAQGLRAPSQQGVMALPWSAITHVERTSTRGHAQIVFRIHPQALPGQHGVEAAAEDWRGWLRHGLRFGDVGLTPDLDGILAAVNAYTHGRVPIR